MKLRYYQKEAIQAIQEGWKEFQKQLLVMSTGTGKTVIFDTLAAKCASRGQKVLILAHRDELIEQARIKYKNITGQDTAKEKGKETSVDSSCPVVVGSVQTLSRKNRLEKFSSDHFDIIVVDEAHHTLADSYMKILNHFPEAKVLGVTATPDRGDKKNLAFFYENTAYEYSLKRAIEDGFLCRIIARTIPLKIDMRNVHISQGDFELNATADALRPCLNEIAHSIGKYAKDRKTIVFLPLVSIAQEFRALLEKEGLDAREVNGSSTDRKETLEWFDKAKKGSVLCNAMLLTEGYDCPSCDCIVCLRPTKIRSLFSQMVGRGTRLYPGKENLLLLDYLWLTSRHNLCRPVNLLMENPDRKAVAEMENMVEETDIFDMVTDKRRRLAEAIISNMGRRSRVLNPVNWLECIGDTEAADHEDYHDWEKDPVTDKQKAVLDKNGIDSNVTKGMASLLINNIIKRQKMNLCTPRQLKILIRFGYKDAADWSFDLAGKKIDELAKVNWDKSLLPVAPEYFRP